MEACLNDFKNWLDVWLEEVNPWNTNNVARERFIWIRLQGVPLHLWSGKFFFTVGNSLGSFITSDNNTHNLHRFDIARILISVKEKTIIYLSLSFRAMTLFLASLSLRNQFKTSQTCTPI